MSKTLPFRPSAPAAWLRLPRKLPALQPALIATRIASEMVAFTSFMLAYIKRLVRNATETPLAQGLALERNLFLKLCISEPALARMRSYEEKKITSPSHSIEV